MISIKLKDVPPNSITEQEHMSPALKKHLETIVFKAINNLPDNAWMVNVDVNVIIDRFTPLENKSETVKPN